MKTYIYIYLQEDLHVTYAVEGLDHRVVIDRLNAPQKTKTRHRQSTVQGLEQGQEQSRNFTYLLPASLVRARFLLLVVVLLCCVVVFCVLCFMF